MSSSSAAMPYIDTLNSVCRCWPGGSRKHGLVSGLSASLIGVPKAVLVLGKPKLFFAVSAGAVDIDGFFIHCGPQGASRRCIYAGQHTWSTPQPPYSHLHQRLKEFIAMCPLLSAASRASLRRFAHYEFLGEGPAFDTLRCQS